MNRLKYLFRLPSGWQLLQCTSSLKPTKKYPSVLTENSKVARDVTDLYTRTRKLKFLNYIPNYKYVMVITLKRGTIAAGQNCMVWLYYVMLLQDIKMQELFKQSEWLKQLTRFNVVITDHLHS